MNKELLIQLITLNLIHALPWPQDIPPQEPVSTSNGNTNGEAQGPGASFFSLAYTHTDTTQGSGSSMGSTYPNDPPPDPIASSGIAYDADGNGGINAGSVSSGSSYLTSSSFESKSPTYYSKGGGKSFGFSPLNGLVGTSTSYGGAISRSKDRGYIMSGGISEGFGVKGVFSKTVTVGWNKKKNGKEKSRSKVKEILFVDKKDGKNEVTRKVIDLTHKGYGYDDYDYNYNYDYDREYYDNEYDY